MIIRKKIQRMVQILDCMHLVTPIVFRCRHSCSGMKIMFVHSRGEEWKWKCQLSVLHVWNSISVSSSHGLVQPALYITISSRQSLSSPPHDSLKHGNNGTNVSFITHLNQSPETNTNTRSIQDKLKRSRELLGLQN